MISRSRRILRIVAGTAALAGVAACNDLSSPDASAASSLIANAFSNAPAQFNEVTSSFAGDGSAPFAGERGPGPGRDGRDGGPGLGFMGGGFGDAFAGGSGGGRGHEGGPFRSRIESTCAFAAGSGDVTCGPNTRGGVTVTRVYTFTTLAGVPQQKPDSATNAERLRITASGTMVDLRRDSITTTVQHSSDRTVTGLAYNATQRTVNGTSTGTESTSGTNRHGVRFTAVRVSGDTTQGLIIPIVAAGGSYPTAGTVKREMRVTMTLAAGTPTVTTRREVITYNGTTTAAVVITTNGTSKTCTLPLPRGRMSCPD